MIMNAERLSEFGRLVVDLLLTWEHYWIICGNIGGRFGNVVLDNFLKYGKKFANILLENGFV